MASRQRITLAEANAILQSEVARLAKENQEQQQQIEQLTMLCGRLREQLDRSIERNQQLEQHYTQLRQWIVAQVQDGTTIEMRGRNTEND
jgi:predicted nuclease with TOPRIM domain